MKRFLVFSGWYYYPSGGWEDFSDSFDTLDEAKEHGKVLIDPMSKSGGGNDWAHVVDSEKSEEVWDSN